LPHSGGIGQSYFGAVLTSLSLPFCFRLSQSTCAASCGKRLHLPIGRARRVVRKHVADSGGITSITYPRRATPRRARSSPTRATTSAARPRSPRPSQVRPSTTSLGRLSRSPGRPHRNRARLQVPESGRLHQVRFHVLARHAAPHHASSASAATGPTSTSTRLAQTGHIYDMVDNFDSTNNRHYDYDRRFRLSAYWLNPTRGDGTQSGLAQTGHIYDMATTSTRPTTATTTTTAGSVSAPTG